MFFCKQKGESLNEDSSKSLFGRQFVILTFVIKNENYFDIVKTARIFGVYGFKNTFIYESKERCLQAGNLYFYLLFIYCILFKL